MDASRNGAGDPGIAGQVHAKGPREAPVDPGRRPSWTFLTNHAHVLLCVAREPDVRLRDVALRVGITERAAQKIVHDLVEADYLAVERVGRRNSYRLDPHGRFRHPLEADREVGDLLALFPG